MPTQPNEILGFRLKGRSDSDEDIIEPGRRVIFETDNRALTRIRDAHPGMQVLTPDSQCLFAPASSRFNGKRLSLSAGQRSTIVFSFGLGGHGGVFLLSFTLSPKSELQTNGYISVRACSEWWSPRAARSAGVLRMNPNLDMSVRQRGVAHKWCEETPTWLCVRKSVLLFPAIDLRIC
jgi:hypothetical protein